MWWTVVTFAAVATWFEWVYRKEHKNPQADSDSPAETPVESSSATVEPKIAEIPASAQGEPAESVEAIAQSPSVEPDLGPKPVASDFSSNSPENKMAS